MPKLSITVSPDGMEAFISPTTELREARDITLEEVTELLRQEGIAYGVDEGAIKTFVSAVEAGDPPRSKVRIAGGTPAARGAAPGAVIRFEDNQLVRKGETLALLEGGDPPSAGRTVRDEEIPAREALQPPVIAGDHTEYHEDDRSFRSLLPGYAKRDGSRINVEPLVRVSDDLMTASLKMHPRRESEPPIAPADLGALLQEAGVVHGVQEAALDTVLKSLEASGELSDWIVVAQGTAPMRGQDASFRFLVEAETRVGVELEDGRIDYHQQRETPAVKAGDVIVEKIPATDGRTGMTVTGEEIAPEPADELELECAENLTRSEDGLRYAAAVHGVLFRDGNRVRVLELYEVNGDVDFSTGNVDSEKCGVSVRGTVRSTFAVKANGTIVVGETIEDAIVRSTENIEVKKGIVQGKVGSVTAGGSVKAAFALNAAVFAGDSIEIRDSAFHCFLAARDSVRIVEGKGVLVGGHVVAGQCVEVRIAGSTANMPTVIQVGMDYQRMREIEDQLRPVELEIAKILASGGESFTRHTEQRASPPNDPRLRDLLDRWLEQERQKESILNRRAEILRESTVKLNERTQIVVKEIVHQGVELRIGQAAYRIMQTIPGGTFRLDPESNTIVCPEE